MADEKMAVPLRCGLVMPISDIEGYPPGHWAEVKSIITAAVRSLTDLQFEVDLVSSSEVAGVIQRRIVQRLYSDDIVICDVSAKNANVMFELGMRLAFDKPTVLIKDDVTPYIFDTGPLEHIEYPASLRHSQVQAFTAALAEKVKATYERSRENADSTSYLKSFGTFEVARIPTKYVEGQDVVIGELKQMRQEMSVLHRVVADTHASSQKALAVAHAAQSLGLGLATPGLGMVPPSSKAVAILTGEPQSTAEKRNLLADALLRGTTGTKG